ncbi:ArsO family NAD(P)H-dependent flavin-containing monooxygenase [Dyadobacter frigoris]|uniref:Pyridine nucleotide-disulfide oxidoreductase n=1 Tax=Dyadobacter frigoris TaxID=2576211 RepID=A0A4U6CTL2_9BACT|nr:ArsO family NAD(P)H-dependent flavin-containing monooxygenase [Dyadobacter frigoris]TKT87999.1 pyridine nucleotide-disulfide oxidoreductase [Dyadobacter frigoris]GLU52898.1 monooxygenase [Dyadobacter frigoris]
MEVFDLIIIGGGQSALACGYFLRRADLKYIILDDQQQGGGAWQHTWDSLTLFSPAEYSSLPGRMMPKSKNEFPSRQEVLDYLSAYQKRYDLSIQHGIKVTNVQKEGAIFTLTTNRGDYQSRAVISSTGTFQKPFIPDVPGNDLFKGEQLHSAHYKNADPFRNKTVLIVGAGNSGAQILSEVSKVTKTVWSCQNEPEFLPDDVDGRVLFDVASAKYHAMKEGKEFTASQYNVGNIVMVPTVKDARKRGVLKTRETFKAIYEEGVVWQDGIRQPFDVIIWCTGFGFATDHLKGLGVLKENGKIDCQGTKSADAAGLWLVGYGSFTGFASATLIGVGRSARQTVNEIIEYLKI